MKGYFLFGIWSFVLYGSARGTGVNLGRGLPPEIMRELCAHLDALTSPVMELLAELHQTGATICIVTHDPRYARHAERHIYLFDGQLADEPTVEPPPGSAPALNVSA